LPVVSLGGLFFALKGMPFFAVEGADAVIFFPLEFAAGVLLF
jgi:hypothetical protein